ncbi:hypothetical protein VP01_3238g3 [Puccinia sorghi]|uniref:Uncharacterized protein n=1 Tax=Puccinia sorghi TaxID=27349 RepID=A0A0L6V010_9BASI|nr:hypothetical protein VP01_3238g3 [Puccinia sorghi]
MSFCNMKETTLDVFDVNQFTLRSGEEMRSPCIWWKKAPTNSKCGRIFTRHGVRYSVLLKLPYFNLPENSVVEPMHNIFLGLLRHHGTEFFGLKKNEASNH